MPLPGLKEAEKRRKRLGLTQARLTFLSGVSRSSIARIEIAYRDKKPNERAHYVPNYEDAKRILDTLEKEEEALRGGIGLLKAGSLAHSPIVSAHPKDKVEKSKAVMKDHGYSQLPVVENGICVGCITDSIILEAVSKQRSLEKIYGDVVSNLMGEPFPMVGEDTPVSVVIPLIRQSKAVLTTKKGKISGILTALDVME